MQATRSQSIWRRPEELQVKDESEIQHLGTNNSVGFLHLQLIHILALSPQVTVYIAWVLAKHIQVWNQDSLGYGMESGWCKLHCRPFSGAQLLELWYRVLETLLYLLLTRVIWSSHIDLSGSGPHKLIALSLIH